MTKAIEGFEGLYTVSDSGLVFGQGGVPLKPGVNSKTGYLSVVLCHKGKKSTRRVHRLVARAFVPNPNNLPEVNHKDGNKQNNVAQNLEWCDRSQNVKHAYATGLRETKRIAAYTKDGLLIRVFPSVLEAQAFVGVSYNASISRCLAGKAKSAHGYVWQYE